MTDEENIIDEKKTAGEAVVGDIMEGATVSGQPEISNPPTGEAGPKSETKSSFFHRCKKCEKLEKECEEYKTGWHRALADYKNLQKEISERRAEWAQLSERQILEEFIPVYDHLKMSVVGAADGGAWLEGVKHVLRRFAEILKNHGVEEIKTVGEKFDPSFHEAVGEEESEKEEGIILKEIGSGYKMSGRVIKAAKVIVSKIKNKT